jgi:hypothetical protein
MEQKSATFIERQHFHVLSNFMTKGYRSGHNETAALLHGNNEMLIGGQK